MGWTARLKALDDRVLPKPKRITLRDLRRATIIGVVAALAFVIAAVFIEGPLISGAITMTLLTAINATRWRRLQAEGRTSE